MKFLSMYTPDPKTAAGPPSKEHMEEMGKLIEESIKSGVLRETGGLLPVSKGGARVRRSGGEIAVIDGPFTESKELVAGFAVLETKSKEEAIEITSMHQLNAALAAVMSSHHLGLLCWYFGRQVANPLILPLPYPVAYALVRAAFTLL